MDEWPDAVSLWTRGRIGGHLGAVRCQTHAYLRQGCRAYFPAALPAVSSARLDRPLVTPGLRRIAAEGAVDQSPCQRPRNAAVADRSHPGRPAVQEGHLASRRRGPRDLV